MRVRHLLLGLVCLALAGWSCGGATRATVHEEDMSKVFPWPRSKQKVTIRAMPQTTMANTCYLFGSYESVEVTEDTTFYITDELEKQFAYTPSRSPIRRLAPVKSMEILWPLKKPEKPGDLPAQEAEKEQKGEEGAKGAQTAPKKQP